MVSEWLKITIGVESNTCTIIGLKEKGCFGEYKRVSMIKISEFIGSRLFG